SRETAIGHARSQRRWYVIEICDPGSALASARFNTFLPGTSVHKSRGLSLTRSPHRSAPRSSTADCIVGRVSTVMTSPWLSAARENARPVVTLVRVGTPGPVIFQIG